MKTTFELADVDPTYRTPLNCSVEFNGLNVALGFEGYGEHGVAKGLGTPVVIEKKSDDVRVIVWADINSQDPTHIISMNGAREESKYELVNRRDAISQPAVKPEVFTREEMLIIMAVARHTLADGNLFEEVAQKLDLNDDTLRSLWQKLEHRMGMEGEPFAPETETLGGGQVYLTLNPDEPAIEVDTIVGADENVVALIPHVSPYTMKCSPEGELYWVEETEHYTVVGKKSERSK